VIVGEPDQTPVVVERVCPSVVVPLTTGREVLVGAIPAITLVATEVAEEVPAELLAVTTILRVCPISAEVST
jgi:hypothetical protein